MERVGVSGGIDAFVASDSSIVGSFSFSPAI